MPFQAISNKLEVYNFPTDFESIGKLEKVLIEKRILFKKVVIMPCAQMKKITGTICNIPVAYIDVTNFLLKTVDSNGLVVVKLKRKLEYCGHVLFDAMRPDFLRKVLSYLKKNDN